MNYTQWRHDTVGDVAALASVKPYEPRKVYINFLRDTVYFGPEFKSDHLDIFLTKTGEEQELKELRYIAFSSKLFLAANRRWDELRSSLYALRKRPVEEVILVPDDERRCLEDKWYYGKHEIKFEKPRWRYTLKPGGGEREKGVVRKLEEWMEKHWKKDEGLVGPAVTVQSISRKGESLSDFKEGMWEVQKGVGSEREWEVWEKWKPEIA